MSRRDRYPEITYARWKAARRKDCQAIACNNKAEYRVEIRQTYMRGDDDVFWLCEMHRAAACDGIRTAFDECRRVYKMTGNYHGDSK